MKMRCDLFSLKEGLDSMEREFSPEELSQLVKAAQIVAPGFTQDEYQSLVDSQEKLSESGFCDATWAVVRLQEQKGINCADALEAVEELLRDKAKLETDIASLEKKHALLEEKTRQAEETHRQLNEAIKQARGKLEALKSEHQKEAQEFNDFKEKARLEKERIDKDLEKCHKKAGITEEEVKVAGNLKAELDKHGFSLELTLGLAQEFAGYEDARDKLAEGLKKYKTLSAFLVSINQEGEEKKKTLQAEISGLEGNRRQAEYVLSQLRGEQTREENLLSQLQSQIAEKGDMVSFYHRHRHLQLLIEYLDNQGGITFHHCTICGALFWIVRPGASNMTACKCPWCGNVFNEPDKTAYTITGQQPGAPVKLIA
jgi:predicted  nucleic acid-binding Zn-ribbon protein